MPGNTAASFISALRTSLETRIQADSAFTDVKVVVIGEGDAGLQEMVVLVRPGSSILAINEHAALGAGRRDEQVTIPGRLHVIGTGNASPSASPFQTAMDRAQALLDHVIDQIRDAPPAVGDQTQRSIVEAVEWTPYTTEGGWVVTGDFDITFKARVS